MKTGAGRLAEGIRAIRNSYLQAVSALEAGKRKRIRPGGITNFPNIALLICCITVSVIFPGSTCAERTPADAGI